MQMYGVLDKQFRNDFLKASSKKGSTGVLLLQMLESRLDNVVYRMGFSRTRAEARQLVSHKSIVVNGKLVNIASYQVKSGDVVEVREASRSQSRIVEALSIATQAGLAAWVDVDEKGRKGKTEKATGK